MSPELATRDGARIYYDEDGPADGPVVLFLHGAFASGRAFRGQLPALRDRYRVILPDQRGHGKSTHFEGEGPWPEIELSTLASDAVELMDHVSPAKPVHLVGISMGGLVAARVAATDPGRLESLTLVSVPAQHDAKWMNYFAHTKPDELPDQTKRLALLWHGEEYWPRLARGLFQHFAKAPLDTFAGRPRPPRALVMQASEDDLLQPEDADVWARRIDAPTSIVRVAGEHQFFADGRDGTRAMNRALRAFLDAG